MHNHEGGRPASPDDDSEESVLARNLGEARRIAHEDDSGLDEIHLSLEDDEALNEEQIEELPLEEISGIIREKLRLLGLKDPNSIDDESILELGELYLDLNEYDVEDLFFYVLNDGLGSNEPVVFKDLVEAVNIREVDIRQVQIVNTAGFSESLVKLGIDQLEVFKWGLVGTQRQKRAIRRMGWILQQPFMNDFVKAIRKSSTTKKTPLRFGAVASNIAPEIEKKQRELDDYIAISELTSRQKKEYEVYQARLNRAGGVCEMVFKEDLKDGVYNGEV